MRPVLSEGKREGKSVVSYEEEEDEEQVTIVFLSNNPLQVSVLIYELMMIIEVKGYGLSGF